MGGLGVGEYHLLAGQEGLLVRVPRVGFVQHHSSSVQSLRNVENTDKRLAI